MCSIMLALVLITTKTLQIFLKKKERNKRKTMLQVRGPLLEEGKTKIEKFLLSFLQSPSKKLMQET